MVRWTRSRQEKDSIATFQASSPKLRLRSIEARYTPGKTSQQDKPESDAITQKAGAFFAPLFLLENFILSAVDLRNSVFFIFP